MAQINYSKITRSMCVSDIIGKFKVVIIVIIPITTKLPKTIWIVSTVISAGNN